MIPLAGLAGFARAATVARAVTPMISRTALGRFGMSRVFPFLKDTLKKGVGLIKRGVRSIGKRIPLFLRSIGGEFGGNENQEKGEFLQPQQEVGDLSTRAVGGSEALGAALPTTRNANIPSLPSYKSGKEGETIIKLLSIAVKYLAGVDATLKNQLDVQRASFTQTNQMAREKSLEGDSAEVAKPTSPVVSMMKNTGSGILSFFSSMLMKTLLLTAPLIIKKISDMVDGFDFGFGDDEEKKDLAPQNGVSGSTTAMNETATRGYRGGGGRGRGGVAAAPAGSSFGSTSFSEVSENIAAAEGTGDRADPYNIVYGYGKYGSPSKPLTEMTLGEVQDFQKNVLIPNTRGKVKAGPNEGTGAVGKYQFNYGTLKEQAEKLYGASWRATKFTPEVQEKLAENLFNERKSSNRGLSSTWAYFRNIDPVGGAILRAQTGGANTPAAQIGAAAVDRAARESGVATTPTTPAPVVVAQNAPPPSSTTVTSGGPGDPSSVSSDRTLMTWIQYFSPLPA